MIGTQRIAEEPLSPDGFEQKRPVICYLPGLSIEPAAYL
jgi:hypothetical protein